MGTVEDDGTWALWWMARDKNTEAVQTSVCTAE